MLANQLPPSQELFGSLVNEDGFQGLMGITTNLFGFFASLASILILSLYWSADSIHFERLLLSLIPVDKRPTARRIWRGIDKGIGAYIRSEFIQSMLAGLLLWLGYSRSGWITLSCWLHWLIMVDPGLVLSSLLSLPC
jgi:predicted PurR-regulated permease PerM